MIGLFEILDHDETGQLSTHQFVAGIEHMLLTHVPVETTQMIQLLRGDRHHMIAMASEIEAIGIAVKRLLQHQGSEKSHSRGVGTPNAKTCDDTISARENGTGQGTQDLCI